jgi:hypothetical protein
VVSDWVWRVVIAISSGGIKKPLAVGEGFAVVLGRCGRYGITNFADARSAGLKKPVNQNP